MAIMDLITDASDPNAPKPIDQPLYRPDVPGGVPVNAKPDASQDPNSPYYNPSGLPTNANNAPWQTTDPDAPYYDPPGWRGGFLYTGFKPLDSAVNLATGTGHISDINQLYKTTGGPQQNDLITGEAKPNLDPLLQRASDTQAGVYDGNRPMPPLPGGTGGQAPPVTAPPAYSGGDFYNSSADTDFYRTLAAQRAGAAAPQLQRTGIDFSGYGSGQGAMPQQSAPTPYPGAGTPGGMGAATQGTQATQAPAGADVQQPMANPSTVDPYVSQAPGGSYAPQYAPPGAGTAAPVSYGGGAPQPQGNTAFGQVAAGNPNAMGAATPQNQTNAPASPNGGGQFSNPLFQQGQESRQQQGQAMDRTASPDLYTNPQQTDAAQSRTAQTQALRATSNPNAYATPDQAAAAQSRGQQQGLMSILNRDVAGGGPSLAEQQLKQGTDANIATANALAASAGPGNAAAASRQAAQTAATAGQQLAGQTAALRAQEYAQARGELGTATTAARGQDLQNLGMDYSNTTNRLGLMSTNAAALRNADLSNLGMTYKNTTDQAQLLAQQAQVKRAQDLQATGMSYDMAVKQAQLEADQNKTQFGGELAQRGLNQSSEMGLLGMGQTAQASEQEAREHAADLLMQKYGVDKNVALQMVGQTGIANVFKGVAAGGAVAGVPGAIAGGLASYIFNKQQPRV